MNQPVTPRRSDVNLRRSIPRPVSIAGTPSPSLSKSTSAAQSQSRGAPLSRQVSTINATRNAKTPARTISPPASVTSFGSVSSRSPPALNRNRTISSLVGTSGSGRIITSPKSLPGAPGRSYKQRYSAYGEPTLSLAIELDELTLRHSYLEDRYADAEERLHYLEGCDQRLEILERQFAEMSAENAQLKEENMSLVLRYVDSREEVAKAKRAEKGSKEGEAPRPTSPMPVRSTPKLNDEENIKKTDDDHRSSLMSKEPSFESAFNVELSHAFISRALHGILRYASDTTDCLPFALSKVSIADANFTKRRVPEDTLDLLRTQCVSPGAFLQAVIVYAFGTYFCQQLLDTFRPGMDRKTNHALDKIRTQILCAESSRTYFTWRSVTYRNCTSICEEDVDIIRDASSHVIKTILSVLEGLIPPDKDILLSSCRDIIKGTQNGIAQIIEDSLQYIHFRKMGSNMSEGGERVLIPKKGEVFNPEQMEIPKFVDGNAKERKPGKVYKVITHILPGVWSGPGELSMPAQVLIGRDDVDVFS